MLPFEIKKTKVPICNKTFQIGQAGMIYIIYFLVYKCF